MGVGSIGKFDDESPCSCGLLTDGRWVVVGAWCLFVFISFVCVLWPLLSVDSIVLDVLSARYHSGPSDNLCRVLFLILDEKKHTGF